MKPNTFIPLALLFGSRVLMHQITISECIWKLRPSPFKRVKNGLDIGQVFEPSSGPKLRKANDYRIPKKTNTKTNLFRPRNMRETWPWEVPSGAQKNKSQSREYTIPKHDQKTDSAEVRFFQSDVWETKTTHLPFPPAPLPLQLTPPLTLPLLLPTRSFSQWTQNQSREMVVIRKNPEKTSRWRVCLQKSQHAHTHPHIRSSHAHTSNIDCLKASQSTNICFRKCILDSWHHREGVQLKNSSMGGACVYEDRVMATLNKLLSLVQATIVPNDIETPLPEVSIGAILSLRSFQHA
jgi:hypothetical protein